MVLGKVGNFVQNWTCVLDVLVFVIYEIAFFGNFTVFTSGVDDEFGNAFDFFCSNEMLFLEIGFDGGLLLFHFFIEAFGTFE